MRSWTGGISLAQRAFGPGCGGIAFPSPFQNSYDVISSNTVKDMITQDEAYEYGIQQFQIRIVGAIDKRISGVIKRYP